VSSMKRKGCRAKDRRTALGKSEGRGVERQREGSKGESGKWLSKEGEKGRIREEGREKTTKKQIRMEEKGSR